MARSTHAGSCRYRRVAGTNVRAGRTAALSAALAAVLFAALPATAADFTVSSGVTDTTPKTLNAGETGTVDSGGTLATTITAVDAITASGANVRFTNNGTVSGLNAIDSSGSGATLINNGTMSSNATTILAFGANSVLINNGTISNTGAAAHALAAGTGADDAVVTNTGTITLTGANADALVAVGDRATLTNSGTITSGNNGLRGLTGTDITILNTGTITGTGANSDGITSTGDRAILINRGTIHTVSEGIDSRGASDRIENSGTITATGANRVGIFANGNNVSIVHSGSITTLGTALGADGIRTAGANPTITVSGSITVTGSLANAIAGGGGDETLNLLPGARIFGPINLGGGNNTINVHTPSGQSVQSSTVTFANAGTLNVTAGDGLVVRNGNTVAVVDPTSLLTNPAALGAVTAGVHQAVNQQLAQTRRPEAVQLAALTRQPGMTDKRHTDFAWVRAFGGRKSRDDDGTILAHQSSAYGTVAGYEFSVGDHSIGALGGVSRGRMKTDVSSVETESSGVFAGVYGEYRFGGWGLGGTILAGHERHDSERQVLDNLNGDETATAEYESYYISPSVSMARSFRIGGGWQLRPSAEVSYTVARYDAYSETGTTSSNLNVDSRTVDVVASRVQLAANHTVAGGRGALQYRIGATYSYHGHDPVDLRLGNGATVHHEGAGAQSSRGGYAGVNGRYGINDRLTLIADAEYGLGSEQERRVIGSVGLEIRF